LNSFGSDLITYFPAVFGDQIAGQRSEDKRSNASATDGDSVCERPALVEVESNRHDGRQVKQTNANACRQQLKSYRL